MLNARIIQRRASRLFSYQLAWAGDTGCDNRRWRAFTNGFYYLAEMGADGVGGNLSRGQAARGSKAHQVEDEDRECEAAGHHDHRSQSAWIGAERVNTMQHINDRKHRHSDRY